MLPKASHRILDSQKITGDLYVATALQLLLC